MFGCSWALAACDRQESRRPESAGAPRPGTSAARAGRARDSIADSAGIESSSAARLVLTPPAELTQLPGFARDTLTRRGCRVLQTRGDRMRNVLRGALMAQGDSDWAVLCARGTDGSILVFSRRGGSPAELPVIGGPIPDVTVPPKPGEIFGDGCAPGINIVPASEMRSTLSGGRIINADETGVDTLPRSERRLPPHDGINSADCEGVSNIYYWTGKRWVRFPGAD